MCAYCVVPYVRGAERSRNPESVIKEAAGLFEKGYREVTLLGQKCRFIHMEGRAIGGELP